MALLPAKPIGFPKRLFQPCSPFFLRSDDCYLSRAYWTDITRDFFQKEVMDK